MEYFKETVAKDGDTLGRFCDALKNGEEKQVEDRKYDQELLENGVDKILKYGIACYKKQCKVKLADA